jgi:tRNA pseudouridine38-40 synthase
LTYPRNDVEGLRRIALTIAYDGTGFAGFQLQANEPTIQGELEIAIARLTGEPTRVRAASRTDAGAHANGQVVDFLTGSSHNAVIFHRALNHYLPPAIRILGAHDVPGGFHARRSATARSYRYSILNRSTPSPLLRHSHHWVPGQLDLQAMNRAASSLLGIRDFRKIVAGHPEDQSAVRWVHRWQIDQSPADDSIIHIDCTGNGFLRHQIRRTNAVLVEIGRGRQPVHAMADALAGRFSSNRQIPTLPAHGLCLMSVHYPEYDHMLKVTSHHETH